MSQILQWHPAFQAAMQIELSEEMDKLEFLKEYNLTSGPLRIDTLIIKKEKDAEIQKQIGRIFKRYNILEYKSPEKSHTVNSFFKVVSYAGLLQSNTQREQEIPPEEITITLIGDRYPRRLLAYLKRRHRIGIEQAYPGIYYVEGLLFPMQVVVQRELDKGENVWLSRLRQNLQMREDVEALARAYKGKDGNPLYSAVMDLIVRANWKIYEEGETVCDALNELFADKLEAKRAEGERKGWMEGKNEGRSEGRYESLRSLLKNSPSLKLEEGARLLGFSQEMLENYRHLSEKQ